GVGTFLLLGRGEAGGDKGPWVAIVPKDAYQELAKREAEAIREQLNGAPKEKALGRAKLGAVLIAALTMCAKDGGADELRGTRETALLVANALNKKDQPAAKSLAAQLPGGKVDPAAKLGAINWGSLLTPAELMDHFDVKSKGGDGIHPDLQSNVRFKGALNGVE